mgnify:CR=1 FL=1
MKTLIDEIFREIKIRGHLEELKKLPDVPSRINRLNEILIKINISKEPLSFYSSDEQLYLLFLLQQAGIDMGICDNFYIFFQGNGENFTTIVATLSSPKNKEPCVKDYKEIVLTSQTNRLEYGQVIQLTCPFFIFLIKLFYEF